MERIAPWFLLGPVEERRFHGLDQLPESRVEEETSMANTGDAGKQLSNPKEGGSLPFQCRVLTSTNYPIWSIRIRAIFKAHGIWEAIDPGTNVDPKKDYSAVAYLYQALPEDLVLQIAHCEHAKDIWDKEGIKASFDAIKTRHLGVERVMEARLQTLKAEFEVARMKDNEKIDDFAAKLAGISSKSASLGAVIEETTLVRKLLTAIPEKFLNIAATIEQLVDLKTVKFQEVVGRLKAYEERIGGRGSNSSQDQLFLTHDESDQKGRFDKSYGRGRGSGQDTRGRGRGRGRSGGRGRGGRGQGSHEGGHTTDRTKKDRSKLQCFRCDAYGHFSADCPTRKNEDQANLSQANADGPTLLMAEVNPKEQSHLCEKTVFPAKYEGQGDGNQVWYLDTGATNHMTGNKSLFSTLDTKVEGTVRFGDDSCVKIEGRGSILLECKTGDQRLLTNILYIPFLKTNIFSLGQADEGGCEAQIREGVLTLIDADGLLLMKVKRSPNRLYKVELKTGKPTCLLTKLTDPTWLWHARLGHISFDTIRRLGNWWKEAGAALEQVYADLCGPIAPATEAGNRYFLLIVDDHSRYMWVSMLKTKDEALDHFRKFKALSQNQYGRRIKVLRTDRGGEFNSNEFKQFCEDEGISRQLTAPYTPQQNGVVERRNQTVLNTTRSMLSAMGMPQNLWAEAVRHAVYLLNRLPTKALKGMTPYEALKGKKPKLEHLRVFGCVGHVKTPVGQAKKLDSRSTPMVHLGTEQGTKAYRMYDVHKGRVVVSRDVTFDEARKWEWHLHQSSNPSPEKEFIIQHHEDDQEPISQEEPDSPNNTPPGSPQRMTDGEASQDSLFSSPRSRVQGRGPMLPGSPNIYNSSDPRESGDRTYDHTPIQGWKHLDEVLSGRDFRNSDNDRAFRVHYARPVYRAASHSFLIRKDTQFRSLMRSTTTASLNNMVVVDVMCGCGCHIICHGNGCKDL
ncbi:hypothetical protein E3N88_08863 [Mikania micrantha]|uniref:Integrase catalytic domain-containing protein n=1 Tax=Mikania micrantha TaxID=192012 RepID=A0A5N6PIE4_9ASTR|nr:hypothetical protein E3N88_08863 [Mikania micrantha]